MKLPRYDMGVRPSQITPESQYFSRRQVLAAAASISAMSLRPLSVLAQASVVTAAAASGSEVFAAEASDAHALMLKPDKSPYSVNEAVTSIEVATTKTRFRELEPDIEKNGHGFVTSPWQLAIEGECLKPRIFGLDELLRIAPMQERIYRMLCNEGFLHVVPYIGYSLSELLKKVEPTNNAKFLEMTAVMNPTQLPGQREITYIPWPYVEGLRIDEAMHPLTLVAMGAYGKLLPKGLGSPIAIRAPWKFGTKSPKAVVRLRLTEKQPATIWTTRYPQYHSFWGNINPAGVTNVLGWGQQERKAGDIFKRATPLFNGYAEHVASMYAGMNPNEMF